MGYKNLRECLEDLKATGRLVEITREVDPHLEAAEIHRRVFQAGGPALWFRNLKGSSFSATSNLFGTKDRMEYIFRDTLPALKHLFAVKANPANAFKHMGKSLGLPLTLLSALPRKVSNGPVLAHRTTVDQLPQIQSWPEDGGAFITLPQVYTEHPERPGLFASNIGMYRVQLSGNDYIPNEEAGLHYQIHRGIGIHHNAAKIRNQPLRVSVFVGGPPAHTLAAVMPLPPILSELVFAGVLGGRRFSYVKQNASVISAEADFCITGTIDPSYTKPEGPFGDHLGYYSLKHPFPVMKVETVHHRTEAIWPFTVVGRPPQEDSFFGEIIHELTGDLIPQEIPGIKSLNAVDAAGVHPLMLAVGQERYVPYQERRPMELLTQANAILGYGQCSLAKYLWIAAVEDDARLHAKDISRFFKHMLERVAWEEDLHFYTNTTMDTLDYSGTDINRGSKVVIAAAGRARRTLSAQIPKNLNLPSGFKQPACPLPGILMLTAPEYKNAREGKKDRRELTKHLENADLEGFPLIVLTDDSGFSAKSLENFLWVAFTRSNPAADIDGIQSFTRDKHWGCRGSLIIDARIKPHHAPPLESNPKIGKKVEALGARGMPLHGWI